MRVVQSVVLLSDIESAGFDDERSIELRRLPAGALLPWTRGGGGGTK